MFLKKYNFIVLALLTISCAAPKEETINLSLNYQNDTGPKLNIKNYLDGSLEGWGLFEDANGNITKRFTTKVKGTWEDDKGVIKRDFVFDGSKKESRTWLITVEKDEFTAVGHEVIGTAKGQQYKGVAQMIYKVKMAFEGPKEETTVTETLYNIDNKSSISVFEFKVGKIKKGKMILSLHKVSDENLEKKVTKNESVVPTQESPVKGSSVKGESLEATKPAAQ